MPWQPLAMAPGTLDVLELPPGSGSGSAVAPRAAPATRQSMPSQGTPDLSERPAWVSPWPKARSAGEDLGEEMLWHRLPRQLGDLA